MEGPSPTSAPVQCDSNRNLSWALGACSTAPYRFTCFDVCIAHHLLSLGEDLKSRDLAEPVYSDDLPLLPRGGSFFFGSPGVLRPSLLILSSNPFSPFARIGRSAYRFIRW